MPPPVRYARSSTLPGARPCCGARRGRGGAEVVQGGDEGLVSEADTNAVSSRRYVLKHMSEPLFTFADLVARVCPALEGIDKWKAVRHLDNRPGVPDLIELFHLDREALEFYQAEQSRDVFGACDGIFSFLGLPGRRALFVGAYQVRGSRTATMPDP